MKLDILVIAVHPDDAELGCAGTILSHVAQGKKVGLVDLTRGELGTRGTPELRLQEAAAAAAVLGLSVRENLGFRDGFFRNDEEHQLALIPAIRRYRPDIVFANALTDRHPDHGRAADLIRDTCFYAGLRQVKTCEADGTEQAAWRPRQLFHFIQDRYLKPDFVVDVSDFWEQKLASIRAYRSQFYDPASTEPQSYISSEAFWRFLEARSREMGHLIGVTHGEGFTSERMLGVKSVTEFL